MSVLAIVGGQYGSEGKGLVAQALAPLTDVAVRVGGPNAGHTIQHEGRTWKMRSIPCAWTNPNAVLMIGPGAIIDPEVLHTEVTDLEEAGYSIGDRLLIDRRAWVIGPYDRRVDQSNVGRIGSTGEGVGPARIRRIERNYTHRVALDGLPGQVVDTSRLLEVGREGRTILEGTQGFGLSLVHGTWPWVTSADCTVAQLYNDCGVAYRPADMSIMVMRTFPIRVAGPSGPMHTELSWDDISTRMGRPTEERTTVTNNIRRIGEWDWALATRAARINDPTGIFLTFLDYLDPAVEGMIDWNEIMERSTVIRDFIAQVEGRLGAPVIGVATGGDHRGYAWDSAYSYLLGGHPGVG